ncbi:MAG: DNA/RNA helicase domain-containing protein [Verrucomicrobiota bacterium]
MARGHAPGTPHNRVYLRNAYRVLLTRARQGMVVFVPPGDTADPTRSPTFYDSTVNYLRELGIPEIS